jgi:fatty acid desaturase
MSAARRKPKLPPGFYARSLRGTAALIGTMLLMFGGGGAVNTYVWLHTALPVAIKLLVTAPVFLLAGQGMHLMGWIGHDGLHFNLARSRHASAVIGIVCSAMTVLFLEMGMALDHWTHHRYTNTDKDPDLALFEKNGGFLSRMLCTRARANRLYLRRILRLALGRDLDEEVSRIVFPFPLPTIRRYARLNLLAVAGWAAIYAALIAADWRIGIIGYLIPTIVSSAISGLRPYIEHNGTGVEELHNTRTRTSRLWTILDFGANYHLEHHLYPGVPQWRLPRLHRHLKQLGLYDEGCHFESSFLGNYRFAFGDYVYPQGAVPAGARATEAEMF